MKKLYSLLLVLCLIFSLSACGGNETAKDDDTGSSTTQNQTDVTDTSSTEQSTDTPDSTTGKPTTTTKPSTPAHTHSYSDATCTAPAKCSCGITNGSALGHNYNRGVCSRCGNKDSNYIEFVTIPNFVGLSKNEAENLAESLGLKVAFITDTYSSEYKENVITKQSSEKDVLMTKGATITLNVNNTIYKHFNLKLIDDKTTIWGTILLGGGIAPGDPTVEHLQKGTYLITSLNKSSLPSALIIPETYNGIKITAIDKILLDATTVETVVIPKTITAVGINMCGHTCNCPSLGKIICLSEKPFYLGSFSLDNNQLSGGCKIYVPDAQVNAYKNSEVGEIPFKNYADLIYPISSLDEATKNLIS